MAAGDQADHGVADELFLTDDQSRELSLQRMREIRHLRAVDSRLFSDHCPPVGSPRLEK